MKKVIFAVLAVCMCLSLCSCGGFDYKSIEGNFTNKGFEKHFLINDDLTNAKSSFVAAGERVGVDIDGDIQLISMYTKPTSRNTSDYAYIIQCYDEAGAVEVESIVKNGTICKRVGRIVVYGNTEIINGIN